MAVIVSSYISDFKVWGERDTDRSGGVKFPNSESTPKTELISKIPPPWKRWSHLALISKTPAAGFGLAGNIIFGFMGPWLEVDVCKSGAKIGCGSWGYSCGSGSPGTSGCMGDRHGCSDRPGVPWEGDGSSGCTGWFAM